jgi:hypothetical protein
MKKDNNEPNTENTAQYHRSYRGRIPSVANPAEGCLVPRHIRVNEEKTHPSKTLASLDKLTARTSCSVSDEFDPFIKKHFFSSGSNLKYSKIKLWFNELDNGDTVFSFNPSDFNCFSEALELLDEIFGKGVRSAKISRLDCALTLPHQFDEVFRGLDFGPRRTIESYPESANQRGVYVGKHKRKYACLIYDKQKKEKLSYPCTRLEINSIPKGGLELKQLPKIKRHTPFSKMKRYKVKFKKPTKTQERVLERYYTFKSRVRREGFWWTKRRLNAESNGNFAKLYGKFYELEPIEPSLDKVFQTLIKDYFKKP